MIKLLALVLAAVAAVPAAAKTPTVADARAFVERAESELQELNVAASRAAWVHDTHITEDTEKLAAHADEAYSAKVAVLGAEARRYEGLNLPADLRRKIMLLKLSVSAPSPKDPKERRELSEIAAWMAGEYGKGKWCRTPNKCLTLNDMEDILRESRDPKELLEVWKGWRTISPPMRPKYQRFVELANKGAREQGFADVGALWRSRYDMTPAEFSAELERLWGQLKPLYTSLHTYVRHRLIEKYGAEVVGTDGLIPAHLLGNMWAQDWSNVYSLAAPPASNPGYDLDKLLAKRKPDEKEMTRMGERFFTSLGLEALPESFWERSMFKKPQDREVVCHASAWDVESSVDLRIKMCIKPTAEDFITIHHELGHNYYQRAYGHQPYLFRGSANDGFHEALGDTIALSITPEYLKQIGMISKVPSADGDLGLLMRTALERAAFLPFGLVVDQWRFGVFSGATKPQDYNKAWWALAAKYQGVRPPVARTEKDFDPGAKYHVPANTPYTRYFLAHVLEFQFYRALCRQAGFKGPLHRCSFYENKQAGERLNKMMAMGQSRPWPDALEVLTGDRRMDAGAVVEYYAPLKAWLDAENAKLAAKTASR